METDDALAATPPTIAGIEESTWLRQWVSLRRQTTHVVLSSMEKTHLTLRRRHS
jgi:hypothetical protein